MSVPSTRTLNFGLPKFDSTLGALYIGSSVVATILYGVSCLQLFLYTTGSRSAGDKLWLQAFVWLILTQVLSTAEQAMMMAGIYKVLVTDFLNPLALLAGGPGDGVFIYVESLLLACISVLLQWFFCWRIWVVTASSFNLKSRLAFTVLTVSLSIFSFGSYIDLAVNGFTQESPDGNTPGFILAFKLGTSAQVAYDVIVTTAMTWSLQRSRMGIKRKDHVIRIITLFTINTNLITTLFAIGGLVTFLTLPRATVYAGIEFILGKTNFNSFLAMLNARDYLREMFDNAGNTSTAYPQFHNAAYKGESGETTPGPYDGASLPGMSFSPGKSATTTV
ncbi:hypothetical protein CPC08DRAFT_819002 [Agrocybe pediades]|nr:hypothetical protein CPC08DRAFT_819002 [Agrocybe pediades]